jgi:hypothetical protein
MADRKWVTVKSNLPEFGETVDGYNTKTKVVYLDIFFDDSGKWYGSGMDENDGHDLPPTHWCAQIPLPPFPAQ